MLTINLHKKPNFAEFLEDARIISAIQNDFGKHTQAFRASLETMINHDADGDLIKFAEVANKIFAQKISEVTTQEEYDVLFNAIYDEACLAMVISTDIRTYCTTIEYWVEQVKYHDVLCPCCGRPITGDVTNTWKTSLDEHRRLENFYTDFFKARHKDLETMRQLAQKKKFDPLNWQKDLPQAIGALARVEYIEGEPSEVSQVLDDWRAKAAEEETRVAVKAAEEWLAGRSKN